ncbi:RiPP maturation radical SAM C-methyltransferase [Amycolatopsis australiensis]|uniref:Ribosomal peptide maturation radical SAM protein 1 n=1 Tax=Amycolatopsis australiensis TaxID=546364 RepID=A0A1K1SDJ4_9PSEU|nr:RiPP maturation radical SAM C-methyltransferase [Amycolatopsis australiensis]SFW82330.1 ribosomal peptide maturation radical SAM protein 1 [Amycolatopsis australiensis]
MTVSPAVVVSMPFLAADGPSIQLGLLTAIARQHGLAARALHANLDFAARIGPDYYRLLAEHRGRQLGDWLFSVAAFGAAAPDPDGKLTAVLGEELSYLDSPGQSAADRLLLTRERDVPAFLDALADELAGVRVVCFSSTFQQNTASFALARLLKQRDPGVVTVFGGANFDGEMGLELVRSVEWVDFAVLGEGDVAFPRLLDALVCGADPDGIPGVARRVGDEVVAVPAEAPHDRLDDLPVPDYDEYFERAARLGLPTGHVAIPFESARGCWWGAKHHCTFCGLNGTTMRFRAKSPSRVLAELDRQARRYRSFRFDAVDNILDPGYLGRLLPSLAGPGRDYEIFYEVKANLNRAQLKLLAQAGVTRLQPGLESLSSAVLRLMDKGVRAAQNVNLLRWARYYGIAVAWNILWGFPGETAGEYAAQAAVVPHLHHLQPPAGANRLWLERFSPLFTQPGRFPLKSRRPEPSYRYVYPATTDIGRIAYFFDYEPEHELPPEVYTPLRDAVAAWSAAWQADPLPALVYRSAPGLLRIHDGRQPGRHGTHTFHDALAAIYLACVDRPRTAVAVHRELGLPVRVSAVEDAFRRFAERGLMFLDGNLALSLALPATPGR